MVCRGRFTPADDNKYRIKDEDKNNNSDDDDDDYIKNTTELLHIKPTNIQSSTIDTTNDDQMKQQQSMNKKDLSTISERTERSTMTQAVFRMQQHQQLANDNEKQIQNRINPHKNIVPRLGNGNTYSYL